MLTFVITCPHCREKFRVCFRQRGRRVACQHCGSLGNIPTNASPKVNMSTPEPSAWQAECERAVLIVSNLLTASGRRATTCGVIEIIRQIPRSVSDKVPGDVLICRCIREAGKAGWPKAEEDEFYSLVVRL